MPDIVEQRQQQLIKLSNNSKHHGKEPSMNGSDGAGSSGGPAGGGAPNGTSNGSSASSNHAGPVDSSSSSQQPPPAAMLNGQSLGAAAQLPAQPGSTGSSSATPSANPTAGLAQAAGQEQPLSAVQVRIDMPADLRRLHQQLGNTFLASSIQADPHSPPICSRIRRLLRRCRTSRCRWRW